MIHFQHEDSYIIKCLYFTGKVLTWPEPTHDVFKQRWCCFKPHSTKRDLIRWVAWLCI